MKEILEMWVKLYVLRFEAIKLSSAGKKKKAEKKAQESLAVWNRLKEIEPDIPPIRLWSEADFLELALKEYFMQFFWSAYFRHKYLNEDGGVWIDDDKQLYPDEPLWFPGLDDFGDDFDDDFE